MFQVVEKFHRAYPSQCSLIFTGICEFIQSLWENNDPNTEVFLKIVIEFVSLNMNSRQFHDYLVDKWSITAPPGQKDSELAIFMYSQIEKWKTIDFHEIKQSSAFSNSFSSSPPSSFCQTVYYSS